MKCKKEALRNFERYVASMRTRNCKVCTFRTYLESKYAPGAIKDFIRVNGIINSREGQSAHAKMHVAERMNRTLTEMAKKLLFYAGIQKVWWGLDLSY